MSPSSPLPARAVSAAARSPARRARRYQHDAKPKELERALDAVVEDCVADVGVDANAASECLLASVAGLSASVARALRARVLADGPLASRAALRDVPGIGPKTFANIAGFLRITQSRRATFLDLP